MYSLFLREFHRFVLRGGGGGGAGGGGGGEEELGSRLGTSSEKDRKRAGQGKSGDLGGRRIIKKKKHNNNF